MRRPATIWRAALAVTTGLVLVGTLGATAVVGESWVGRITGAEATALEAATRTVPVDPADTALVCPGPVELPDGADVGDREFAATPVETSTSLRAAADGSVTGPRVTGLDGEAADDGSSGSWGEVVTDAPDGARVTSGLPDGAAESWFASAVGSVTPAGDLRGLTAARCGEPATEHWLVGGDTLVGSTAVLAVHNPSPRSATVTIAAHGPGGAVAVAGEGAFTLGSGEVRTLRLDSVAPQQRRLAVHVVASGARVTAAMQVQAIDGLVPDGVDVVTPAPATRTFAVSGVVSRGEAVDDARSPRLWMLAPGEEYVSARMTVHGPDGPVTLRGATEVSLAPGAVTDVPLGGLDAGTYTVVVEADAPVVGSARLEVPGTPAPDAVVDGAPHDVAWLVGQEVTGSGAGLAAVPAVATEAVVVLSGVPRDGAEDVAPGGGAPVTVRGIDGEGDVAGSVEMTVPVGGTVEVAAEDIGGLPAVVEVDALEAPDAVFVAWSLRLAADDGTDDPGTLVAALNPSPVLGEAGGIAVRRTDAW